jgi:hypothetical protein
VDCLLAGFWRGSDDGVDLGPVIDDAAVEKLGKLVGDALVRGATLLHGAPPKAPHRWTRVRIDFSLYLQCRYCHAGRRCKYVLARTRCADGDSATKTLLVWSGPSGPLMTSRAPTETNSVLDPEAPGLDEETRRRRRVLASLHELPVEELSKLMVRSGIYTEDGELCSPAGRHRDRRAVAQAAVEADREGPGRVVDEPATHADDAVDVRPQRVGLDGAIAGAEDDELDRGPGSAERFLERLDRHQLRSEVAATAR